MSRSEVGNLLERWPRSDWKLPALGGALFVLGPVLPLLPAALLGFLPLLYWFDAREDAGRYARLKAGFAFGLMYYGIGLHFFFALTRFSWLAVLLWAGFSLAGAARVALFGALLGWARQRSRWSWGILLPVTWLPFEWAQTFGDLRMTGDHVAYSIAGYPFLVQFADLLGPYGVGAFLLACNGLLYEALLVRRGRARRRAVAALALLVAVTLAYDGWAWTRSAGQEGSLRVALVQPDIPLLVKRGEGTDYEQWKVLDELSREAATARPQLIVWPESARPAPLYHWLDRPDTYAMPDVQALARDLGIPLLVGVEYARIRDRDEFDAYNAAVLVDAEGRLDPNWAAKVYLVPFVEATPFRGLLGPLVEDRGGEWRWLAGGFRPGGRATVLTLDGARAGVLVCYEQLFAELARSLRNAGARLQVVITNDAWFGRTFFQRYQADALRLRAIENRSPFVRVANTGISGFVDQYGRYHERTRLFEKAVEVYDVRLAGRRTLYDRTGDAIVWVLLLGLSGVVATGRRRRARPRRAAGA